MGLRSEEARVLSTSSIAPNRADGLTPWLTVHGNGAKTRELPIPLEVADAVLAWLEQRERTVAPNAGIQFPRLGRQRADGRFPDAGVRQDERGAAIDDGRLSAAALRDIVPTGDARCQRAGSARAPAGAPPHLRHAVHDSSERADRATANVDGPRRHLHHLGLAAPHHPRPRGCRSGAAPRPRHTANETAGLATGEEQGHSHRRRESWFRPGAELSADSSTLILRSGAGMLVPKRPLLLSEKTPGRLACRHVGGEQSGSTAGCSWPRKAVRILATRQGSVESSCENRGSEARSAAAKNRSGWTTRSKSCVETRPIRFGRRQDLRALLLGVQTRDRGRRGNMCVPSTAV